LGQSIAAIPSTLSTVTQQVLTGDLLGALTTVETYLVGSIVAVGEPTLAAIIERRQRVLAVQQALQLAVPEAFFDVVGGFGLDEVARAFIVAGQGLVDAVLSFSPGAIVDALVNGTALVLGSFAEGGQHVVDGIVSAQQTIATALAAKPDPTAVAVSAHVANPAATDVPKLSRKNITVAVTLPVDTAESPTDSADIAKAPDTTESNATEGDTPKADGDADQTTAKDSTSTAADNPKAAGAGAPTSDEDKKTENSPKHEDKKADASPKHENNKAGNESQSDGADPK
jgi:hypothetical protein